MTRNYARMWQQRNVHAFFIRRRIYDRARDWQMLLNVKICSVMRMKKGNKKFKYDIEKKP